MPEELKLAVHLRGQAYPRRWTLGCNPPEAISIANRSSLIGSHLYCHSKQVTLNRELPGSLLDSFVMSVYHLSGLLSLTFVKFDPKSLVEHGPAFTSRSTMRIWCLFFCPFGLVSWVVEQVSLYHPCIDREAYKDCQRCVEACSSGASEFSCIVFDPQFKEAYTDADSNTTQQWAYFGVLS